MNTRELSLTKNTRANAKSVVYIMSRDQRVKDNHALLAAQTEAIEQNLPLIVAFVLLPKTGYRKREHYEFMLDGLKQVEKDLRAKNITFCLRTGSLFEELTTIEKIFLPRTVYYDFSPMNGPRAVQKKFAQSAGCAVKIVDTHNIVPTWLASDKEEFAAHTFRRKIHKTIETWCVEPATLKKHPQTFTGAFNSLAWQDADAIIAMLPGNAVSYRFKSGEIAAHAQLDTFLNSKLDIYAADRNDATKDGQSDLSPYLHYGQISSLRVVLECLKRSSWPPIIFRMPKMPNYEGAPTIDDSIDAFLEELIVRKELSDNFCFYQKDYASLDGAREWARKSFAEHADDPREFIYTLKQFDDAQTHDELWNAAQNQLRKSGKIHGYLRMYWAKKILEWSESPSDAIAIAIELNDSYTIDGGDPNGYVGILWSIAGLHDRPWFERSVFGKIRFMAASGSAKKFDTVTYIKKWN